MASNIGILIVEKTGLIKPLCVKTFKEEELYKKCGFKTKENFNKYTDWKLKSGDLTYIVSLYGKNVGRANSENKYDFPPPNDNTLFFGNCSLVLHTEYKGESGKPIVETLDTELWEKIYEKLFGGFEDLASTAIEDDLEVDELENIPSSMKTDNGGYLKDGFVVEDGEEEEEIGSELETSGTFGNDDDDSLSEVSEMDSELSEESYVFDEL